MIELVEQNLDAIGALCREYGVRRLDLFGSAATGAFDEATSDLDFVATFSDTELPGYADRYLGFAEALEALFGRAVDVVTEASMRSPWFRQAVEASRQPVYDEQDAAISELFTDWARLEAMTGEEALGNALNDPDSQPLTAEQRARLRRVPDPRAIRQRMGLTQEAFARRFEIALGTLRDWEQGVHIPDSTAKAYLRVIEANPEAVVDALAGRSPAGAIRQG